MDLLPFCEKHKIPLVIDFFHQECYELMHPEEETCVWSEVIPNVRKIWEGRNKRMKFHVSGQQAEHRLGTHSHFCDIIPDEIKLLQDDGIDVDVMLECKAKEFALFDCYEKNRDRVSMYNPFRSVFLPYLERLTPKFISLEELKKNEKHLLITDEEKQAILKSLNGGKLLDMEEIDHQKALDGV